VKKKVFDLATNIVGDIGRMAEAFGRGTASDEYLVESWKDLTALRYARSFR
jgi:hypothetical protein